MTDSNNFSRHLEAHGAEKKKFPLFGFADTVILFTLPNNHKNLDLLHEDLKQIDDEELEEKAINWQKARLLFE
ncbi:hypothetical protein Tco_0932602 [Tanacetum coccineum]